MASRARSLGLPPLAAAWTAAVAVWALVRAVLWGAMALPVAEPGLAALVLLLALSAWAVMEEPRLGPDGLRPLLPWLGAALLAPAGEALIFYEIPAKDAFAPLAFGLLLAAAALLWPAGRGRRLALGCAGGLGLLGLRTLSTRAVIAWDLFQGPLHGQASMALFWLLLPAGILALAWQGRRGDGSLAGEGLTRGQEAWGLGLILLAGGVLRFYKAAHLPAGWWYDEINLARAIQDHVLARHEAPLYVAEQVENPGAWLWLGGALMKAFGSTVETLRVASGALGLLAVLPFWGLARLWAGPRWALAAAFAYACMRWTLVPQRIAFMSGFALFWMLAAFWALWSAALRGGAGRTEKAPWRWALAGLLLGFNLHTYTPARLVPPLALGFLLMQAWLDPAWRLSRRQWLALGAGFLLSAGPMLWYIGHHWHEYVYRSAQVSIFTDVKASGKALGPELWGTAAKHLLMFHFRGDFNARHNVHFLPHVDLISACLLFFALPWGLGRFFRDARARFTLLWIGGMLAAGALTMPVEAPQGHRTVLAAPAVLLLILLALPPLLRPLKAAFGGAWPRTLRLLGLGLLLSVGLLNADELLRQWPDAPATFRSFSPRASAVLRRVRASRPGTAVAVSELRNEYQFNGYEWGVFARFALAPQNRELRVLRPGLGVPSVTDGLPTQSVLLLWGESDADISAAVAQSYPDLAVERVPQPFPATGEPTVLLLGLEIPWSRVPPASGQAPQPLVFRLDDGPR